MLVDVINGDILTTKCEAVVNAANGLGIMGAGIARYISSQGGPSIEQEAKAYSKEINGYKKGDCFITLSGDLKKIGIYEIYHAVVMDYPGDHSLTISDIGKAMTTVLEMSVENGLKRIAFPGLGTGIGRLNLKLVAKTMVKIADDFMGIDIVIADINQKFINNVHLFVSKKEEILNPVV